MHNRTAEAQRVLDNVDADLARSAKKLGKTAAAPPTLPAMHRGA
jgi:hypothetical protein